MSKLAGIQDSTAAIHRDGNCNGTIMHSSFFRSKTFIMFEITVLGVVIVDEDDASLPVVTVVRERRKID